MPDQYICVRCGRPFSRENPRTPPSHCSRTCASKTAAGVSATRAKATKAARRPIPRTCERCAAPFTVEHASSKVRHCSHACYRAGMVGEAHPGQKAKTKRICEQCGSGFETYPYLVRRFCSRSCRSTWVMANVPRRLRSAPRVTIVCPACGKPFSVLESRRAANQHNRHCSAQCASVMHAAVSKSRLIGETRACEICGAAFYFAAYRKREGQPGRFCSPKCNGAWRMTLPRTSTSRDSAEYRDWRAAVYRRDNYSCRRCGARGKGLLHAHHVKYWATHPELRFDVSNGLLLCRSCHAKEHADVFVLRNRGG